MAEIDDLPTVSARPRPFVPLLAYQQADVEDPSRFRWCCWSRQTGKSFTKSLRRLLRGIARGRNQLFLSAGERQSRELMLKVRQHCEVLEIASEMSATHCFDGAEATHLEIRLPNGLRIIGLPANPQTARGFTGDVFLDEFAMHTDDRAIWAAVFPSVLRGDGELDIASTPKGVDNVFARLRDNERFSHSTITLPDAIAHGLQVDLDEVRRSMGDDELFRQEFLCEFLDEAHAFLSYGQIVACEDANLPRTMSPAELAALGEELYVGVDIGRRHDLTVIWVLGGSGGKWTTRSVIELAARPFREQEAELAAILAIRRVRRCVLDASGLGMQLAERLAERFGRYRVEGVCFTAGLKTELAGRLRVAVEDRAVRIPADESIRRDWHSLQRRVGASGRVLFEAPRREGAHADRFWAAALALHAAGDAEAPAEITVARPLSFARGGTW
jgi:phage FluMu gp28-like protein